MPGKLPARRRRLHRAEIIRGQVRNYFESCAPRGPGFARSSLAPVACSCALSGSPRSGKPLPVASRSAFSASGSSPASSVADRPAGVPHRQRQAPHTPHAARASVNVLGRNCHVHWTTRSRVPCAPSRRAPDSLDIAVAAQDVDRRVDEARAKATLPKRAATPVAPVEVARIAASKVAHEQRTCRHVFRRNEQVHMVRHQAIGVQRTRARGEQVAHACADRRRRSLRSPEAFLVDCCRAA